VKTVSMNPDETGMILGSLLLAEDRVLSYAAVLKTDKQYHTKYEPNAVFYFEAETDATQLLQQRRRWINGTVAGYIWLFQNMGLLINSKLQAYQKIFLTILLFSQLMMFVVMALGVAVLTIAIRYPLVTTIQLPRIYADICVGAYVLLYIVFVYYHSKPPSSSSKPKPKLNVMLFDAITIINMIITVLMIVSLVMSIANSIKQHQEQIINLCIVAFNCLMPFILAILHDWHSVILMLKSFIQFTVLLPTFTVFFSVYAFSRTWELTWGNRPSDKLHTMKQGKNETELKDIKNRLLNTARGLAWSLVVINVICAIIFSVIQFDPTFILVVQAFVFFWSSIQMIISLFYFIFYITFTFICGIGRFLLTGSFKHKKMDLRKKFGKKNKDHCAVIASINLNMNEKPVVKAVPKVST
jgi:hypothetical protein